MRCAGKRFDELSAGDLPPCAGERVSFMAPFELARTMRDPYAETSAETLGHFAPTRFVQPQYSAACVPFRWMLRANGEGDAKSSEPGLAQRLSAPQKCFEPKVLRSRGARSSKTNPNFYSSDRGDMQRPARGSNDAIFEVAMTLFLV